MYIRKQNFESFRRISGQNVIIAYKRSFPEANGQRIGFTLEKLFGKIVGRGNHWIKRIEFLDKYFNDL
ncbi:MAG: hypothetical protein JW798_06040 [Prolixibacteraceae bacterium]|nr:hypothetical protein [Prolixibacteraceae bacterium]